MAYKMKNPGLARQCRVAGAGSPARYSSPVKNRTDKDKVQSDYSKMVNDDSEYGGLSKKQIRQQQRTEKRELRKQGKEQAQELKRFGGDQEKLDHYNAKKAEREQKREQYKLDKADQLAEMGKSYNVKDEDGTIRRALPEKATTRAKEQREGTYKRQQGSVSRETASKREAYDKMTPEQQEAYKAEQAAKAKQMMADKQKANVQGGESGLNYNDKAAKKATKAKHKEHKKNLRNAKRTALKEEKAKYKQAKKEIKSYTDY